MFQKIQLNQLFEDKRNQLLSTSRSAKKEKDGKTRYQKRSKSRVKSNVSQLNKIDFNKLFKDNILTVSLDVEGETDNYVVTISFGGFLDQLRDQLARTNNVFSLRAVIRAVIEAFNSDNVYIRCTCKDFQMRFSYWLSRENNIHGQKETRPSNITNPNNDLGDGCKHIMLVLSNNSWCVKLGSVITNYYNYMEKHYKKLWADIIYPAVWDKKYEEPVQLDIDSLDIDDLDTSSDTIDKSNIYARDKNKFKVGNTLGNRFKPKGPARDERNLIKMIDDKDEDNA